MTIFNLYVSDKMVDRSRRWQQFKFFLPFLLFIFPTFSDYMQYQLEQEFGENFGTLIAHHVNDPEVMKKVRMIFIVMAIQDLI